MSIHIDFDVANNPRTPTFILAERNGDKLGLIESQNIHIKDSLRDESEITFEVYKYLDNKENYLWDKIKNFKLVWCREWDKWFEIHIETVETENNVIKTINCTDLGTSELSQINLYSVEINTEDDIAREDYKIPTVLYNPEHPEASLLHRIMEKATHYKIVYVSPTIANIQRTFSFDGKSLYDAFQEISEEINCLFIINVCSDLDGNILRTISVYDLESNCVSCGYRGEFTDICPKCGNTDIKEGYGNDTNIFISADELSNNIQLKTDTNSVKNCFKLEAGDDLMTASIRNCNPNGTDYLWYFSENMFEGMSTELQNKIKSYDTLYSNYQIIYEYNLDNQKLVKYNNLVDKYITYKEDLEKIENVVGYPNLMKSYYNTIDFSGYLEHSLMPDANLSDTSASEQLALLTMANLSPVAVTDISVASKSTVDNTVLSVAKVILDYRYEVEIVSSSYSTKGHVWEGNFKITNSSDEEDTATGSNVVIYVNDDYEKYVKQKLDKALKKSDKEDLSISGLFKKEYDDFCNELKKYCLNRLKSFADACQACIDILIEQDVSNPNTWAGTDETSSSGESNLYTKLYIPYRNKLNSIQTEMTLRQNELDIIADLQNDVITLRNTTQDNLNFEKYLGTDLLNEFNSFRREDKYSNDNYISDGLSNSEIFKKAQEFIDTAEKEIYKSAELQHSISCSLKNLLIIQKFKPIVEYFEVGNWIRCLVDDVIYKLRLISYEIDFDNLEELSVEFSDLTKIKDGISDIQSILSKSNSMASSYSSTKRQANQGEKSNEVIRDWFTNGLDATNVKIIGGADNQCQSWDSHGMLFTEYNSITDSYESEQIKIINSTIAVTDDNWATTKTAVGRFIYVNPETGAMETKYGVNGEAVVGKLIVGENLSIFNKNNSLKFNENGLTITNSTNTVAINPNNQSIFTISNSKGNVLSFDNSGNGTFNGKVTATTGEIAGWIIKGNKLLSVDGTFSIDSANNTITVDDVDGRKTVISKQGVKYSYGEKEIGQIGIRGGASGNYGLTFDLVDGDALTWNVYDSENKVYLNKVRYTETDGFIIHNSLFCDKEIECSGVKIKTDNFYFGNYKLGLNSITIDGQKIQYVSWIET